MRLFLNSDEARPQREPLWEPHGRTVKRVNVAPLSCDVPILAAVVLYPRGLASDWEDAVFGNQSAEVVPQTGLDLRAVVTAAAAGQQHCGERQRSGQEDQANTERTLSTDWILPPSRRDHKRASADAPVDLPIVGGAAIEAG